MKSKEGLTRREFLISMALASVSYAVTSPSLGYRTSILGANDRLRVAVVGIGRAGRRHVAEYAAQDKVEIAALCDVSEFKLGKMSAHMRGTGVRVPELLTDFRRLLDRKDIDAVSIAVPRPLRADLAIEACEAGKDVLIEKPCCQGLQEGRELESVSARTRRLVQQVADVSQYSAPEIVTPLLTRGLDNVLLVRVAHRLAGRGPHIRKGLTSEDMPGIEHCLDNLDLARCLLDVRLPTRVSAAGFLCPGLPSAVRLHLEFPGKEESSRSIIYQSQVETNPYDSLLPACGPRLQSTCTGGAPFMPPADDLIEESTLNIITHRGEFSIRSNNRCTLDDNAYANDWGNFVSCVRERNAETLHNPIREARVSSALLRLAEASLSLGRGFVFDPRQERATADPEVNAFIE